MSDDPQLTERRAAVLAALGERSQKLACIYQMALETLSASPPDGCDSARIAVICHCIRELMNNLPTILAEEEFSPRLNPSSGSLTHKLPELLAQHSTVDLDADQDIIPVPNALAKSISLLIKTVSQENGRNIRNAAALITGGSDTKHPAVKQWNLTYDFFLGWTHLDRNHVGSRTLPSKEELVANIQVVEDVVMTRTAAFFENLHVIEDLLVEINDQTEGGS